MKATSMRSSADGLDKKGCNDKSSRSTRSTRRTRQKKDTQRDKAEKDLTQSQRRLKKKPTTSNAGNSSDDKSTRSTRSGMFATLSERAAKKLRSMGSKPIQEAQLKKAAEKTQKQLQRREQSKTRHKRAFIAGEDMPQRRRRRKVKTLNTTSTHTTPLTRTSALPPSLPFSMTNNQSMSPAVAPQRQASNGIPSPSNNAQSPIAMMGAAPADDPAQPEAENCPPPPKSKSPPRKPVDIAAIKTAETTDIKYPAELGNFENDGELLVDGGAGEKVPFWTKLALEEPDEEGDEVQYNGEAVLLVQSGRLKLAEAPDLKLCLDPLIGMEDLAKRDGLYFNKDLICGNTVRTIIHLSQSDPNKPKKTGDFKTKAVIKPDPATCAMYLRGNLKTALAPIPFTPSEPSYGNLKPIAKR